MSKEASPDTITPAFLESPSSITVPMWVAASGISPTARSLVEPLIAGAMRVHGDQAPTLDREFLAWWMGVNRYDKGVQPALNELVNIGFLVVYDGGVGPDGKRRQRRDPTTNQVLSDVYAVRLDAPSNYRGPRTLSDAYEWFRRDRDTARSAHQRDRKKSKVSVPRTEFGRVEKSQVNSGPPIKGPAGPSTEGPDSFSQVNSGPPIKGPAGPSTEGPDSFSQVNSGPPIKGPLEGGREGTPSREFPPFDRESESAAVCDGPATDSQQDSEVRNLVLRLPWQEKGHTLTRGELSRLVAALSTAQREYSLSIPAMQDHALRALKRSTDNPPVYVLRAFEARNLPASGEISGPRLSLASVDDSGRHSGSSGADTEISGAASEPQIPEWCGQCYEGHEFARVNPRLRFNETPNGPELCTCHPQHSSRTGAP